MKVVIDIPEALYDRVKQLDYTADMYDFADSMYQADIKNLAIAIKDGTPLPTGYHDRLIILSESVIKGEQILLSFSCQKWISEMGLSNATVAIIEPYKEVENED